MKYFLIFLISIASQAFADPDLNEFCTGTVNSRQFCILMSNAGIVNDQAVDQYGNFSAMLTQNPALQERFKAWVARKNGVTPGKPATPPPPPPKKKLDVQFDKLDSMMRRSDSLLNAKLNANID